jgi:hypothetical protein
MAESKYGKYIIYKPKPDRKPPEGMVIPPNINEYLTTVTYLDSEYVKGAFVVDCCWFWKGSDSGPQAHTHDFDEMLAFYGSNPEDPFDLCGEVEMWLDDEKYMLTKSCIVFIPAGLKHCPLIVRRADRPIFHFGIGTAGMYTRKDVK